MAEASRLGSHYGKRSYEWRRCLTWAVEDKDGSLFADLPRELRADKDFVVEWLQAMSRRSDSSACIEEVLRDVCASTALGEDRDFVLKAVALCGSSVRYAHPDLRRDREVILTAVGTIGCGYLRAFEWAPVDLFSDAELMHEACEFEGLPAEYLYNVIFRVALLSGRSCTVIADPSDTGRDIRDRACELLKLDSRRKMQLLLQDEVVHEGGGGGSSTNTWPSVRQEEVNHLQLLIWECAEEAASLSDASEDDAGSRHSWDDFVDYIQGAPSDQPSEYETSDSDNLDDDY